MKKTSSIFKSILKFNLFSAIPKFTIVALIFVVVACNQRERQIETTTENSLTVRQIETITSLSPFTVQITKERSYYQAQKAQERLLKLDVDAYLLANKDSIDREWYNVMSGAFTDSLNSANHMQFLDSVYHLKKCVIIDTRTLTDTFAIILPGLEKKHEVEEHKRIEANTPSLPKDVLDITEMFPENNIFFLEKINILNLAEPKTLSKVVEKLKMDMPRGITLWKLSQYCNSICEVQYQDNLFEDRVTISIMKMKTNYDWKTDMIFEKYNVNKPIENMKSYAIAFDFSEDILNSGNYDNEHMKEIKIAAFKELIGYNVGLTTAKGIYRSYYILTDVDCEYLIFAQSVEKTEKEIMEILAEIGKSKGLNNYDEFYNNFYILPDDPEDEDIFLGYSIDKLGWSYAKEKGNSNWSKAMVGHWTGDGYFWNSKKGLWTITLFDLLTPSSQNYIYGQLYSGDQSENKSKTDVYGVIGYFVDTQYWYYSSLELNFGIGRYVFAIDSENFDRKDMLKRAEKIQFKRGGYKTVEDNL
jgi:hypothetical protein